LFFIFIPHPLQEQHTAYFRAQIETDGQEVWPYPNPQFNCTDGENPRHPKSNRHLTDVLHEVVDQYTYNVEWTYLAKEYAAALINIYNGFETPSEGIAAIDAAQQLLQNCIGYTTNETWYVISAKEKLSRLNNNIGGLSEVDQDLGLLPVIVAHGGANDNTNGDETNVGQSALVVVVVVPIATVVIVAVLVTIGCYVMKRRQRKEQGETYGEMYESEETEDGDNEDALVPPTPTPLNLPRVAERARAGEDEDSDDSTGEDS